MPAYLHTEFEQRTPLLFLMVFLFPPNNFHFPIDLTRRENLIWEDGAGAIGARGTRCAGQLLCGGNARPGSLLALQWRIYKQ